MFLAGKAGGELSAEERALVEEAARFRKEFEAALDNDFNTADAVTAIFELVKFANVHATGASSAQFVKWLAAELAQLADVLGLVLTEDAAASNDGFAQTVETMIATRQEARKSKDFAAADAIRDKLTEMGVVLEDTKDGVRWSRVNV